MNGYYKGFIDRVSVDILWGKVLEKDAMDLCCTVNVELHPGRGNNIFDITWYVTNPTPILYPQSFHARRNCKTNRVLRPIRIRNNQIGFHRIQSPCNTLYCCIIRLLIDHKILWLHIIHPLHTLKYDHYTNIRSISQETN